MQSDSSNDAFVTGFDTTLDQADTKLALHNGLSSFGDILDVDLPANSIFQKQQIAYVRFATAMGIENAVAQSGCCNIAGGILKIERARGAGTRGYRLKPK